jgi:hypothetical protein
MLLKEDESRAFPPFQMRNGIRLAVSNQGK